MSIPNTVTQFIQQVSFLELWNSYRLRSYMFRKNEDDKFKIVILRIDLTSDLKYSTQTQSNDSVTMIDSAHPIIKFEDFMLELSKLNTLGEDRASVELINEGWQKNFHHANIAKSYYGIEYPCLALLATGKRTDFLKEFERSFENEKINGSIYLDIHDACKRLLDLDYN